MKNSTRTQQM